MSWVSLGAFFAAFGAFVGGFFLALLSITSGLSNETAGMAVGGLLMPVAALAFAIYGVVALVRLP